MLGLKDVGGKDVRTPGAHAKETMGQQILGLAKMPLHKKLDKNPFTTRAHVLLSITLAWVGIGREMENVNNKSKVDKGR